MVAKKIFIKKKKTLVLPGKIFVTVDSIDCCKVDVWCKL